MAEGEVNMKEEKEERRIDGEMEESLDGEG
jgi:hypothetical protein